MREIKFRAWDKINKRWVYLPETGDINLIQDYDFIEFDYCKGDIEITQFTGLTDKNGKEVYEGDILKGEFEPFEVIFDNGAFCFASNDRQGTDRIHQFRVEKLQVIGNIYENPELL